jgi:DNA-binding Lrp family transcriptional regulator
MSEDEVVARVRALLERGIIKRLGVIVRHRELGYRANAMVVWDVPDETASEVGHRFSEFDFVTLCYRRPRRPPDWPYNLFCMIHGRDRAAVQNNIASLVGRCGLGHPSYRVLFSIRRFKQCGAVYIAPLSEPRPALEVPLLQTAEVI